MGPLAEDYCAIVLRELLIALEYSHSKHILHGKVSAGKLLLNLNGEVKLSNFTSAEQCVTPRKLHNYSDVHWLAPEVVVESDCDTKVDIWAVGITAIQIAEGEPPYADIHPMRVRFIITQRDPPTLEGDFSPLFKEFVALCLRKNVGERPTAKTLLLHPFIKNAKDTSLLIPLMAQAAAARNVLD